MEFLAEQAPISDVVIANTQSYVARDIHLDGMGHGIQDVAFQGYWLDNIPVLTAAQGNLTSNNATNITFQSGAPPSTLISQGFSMRPKAGHATMGPVFMASGTGTSSGMAIVAPGFGADGFLPAFQVDGKGILMRNPGNRK